MKKVKIKIFLLVTMASIGVSNVSAMEKQDVYRETLQAYNEDFSFDPSISRYISSKGIASEMYEIYSYQMNYYQKEGLAKWYKVNSGAIFYDEILFKNPKVQELYKQLKGETKLSDDKRLRQLTKQELLAKVDTIDILLTETLNIKGVPADVFTEVFNRKPNSQELSWMGKLSTLKYAAYSGCNGGKLSQLDINLINSEKGYTVYTKNMPNKSDGGPSQIEMELLGARDMLAKTKSIEKEIIEYYKIYDSFEGVKVTIQHQYNVNIFKTITQKERKEIYASSIKGIRIDEQVMFNKCVTLLVKKGVVSKNELVANEDPIKDQDYSNVSWPAIAASKYKERKKDAKGFEQIYKILESDFSKFFRGIQSLYKYDKELCFKWKGTEFSTEIPNIEGKLNGPQARALMERIASETKGNSVFSTQKTLIQIDDKLMVIDRIGSNSGEVLINELTAILKQIDIDLYTKEKL